MSMSQQSQPNEDVSPATGEMYMLFQWIPNDEESHWFQSDQKIGSYLGEGACLRRFTFSFDLITGDILTSVTETGRWKQTLQENKMRWFRLNVKKEQLNILDWVIFLVSVT